MTKTERLKHKELVSELRQRRAQGEHNIVIRNGKIITRYPRAQVVEHKTSSDQPLIQLSPAATSSHPQQ